MKKNNHSHPFLQQNKPWANNSNNIWLASSLNLHRNVDNFLFPSKLNRDRRNQLVALISKTLLQSQHLKQPELLRAEEMTPVEKEYLFEHFLSSQSFQQAHSGEGFIVDSSGNFMTVLNVQNHIQFELIDCSGELETSWNYLRGIEKELGQVIDYAFSPKFGYLTANPTFCGTGFTLSVFLQPSALHHTGLIDQCLQEIQKEEIEVTGLQGDPSTIFGDVYAIRNSYTLGVSEENIISALRFFTMRLMAEESSLRSHLKKEGNAELMDKVSRAYGVLIHSYQIETIEALDALSLLKLGADLGWLKGVTPQEVNRLFFDCRHAHLLTHAGQEVEKEEVPHQRAAFIHKALKRCKLLIG